MWTKHIRSFCEAWWQARSLALSSKSNGRWLSGTALCVCFLRLITLAANVEASPLSRSVAVDWIALRDAICTHETRGSADPDAEVGKKGELGRCQVQYFTARGVGFKGHFGLLGIREVNEWWAMQVLTKYCHVPSFDSQGRMTHHGYQTPAGLAFCYNRGKWAGKLNKKDEYVTAVMAIYNAKLLAAR